MGWQLIETAQKDTETPVLLLAGETIPDTPHVVVGTYTDGATAEQLGYREYAKYGAWTIWNSCSDFYLMDINDPTHWMPMPST